MDEYNLDRFWSKVDRTGNCWEWIAHKDRGYGRLRLNGKNISSHRMSYELLVGEIPKGLELDHLCRNTSCCNPDHLEAVTHKENIRRGMTGKNNQYKDKTHCINGHEFNENNTYHYRGMRQCRECHKIRCRKARSSALITLRWESEQTAV